MDREPKPRTLPIAVAGGAMVVCCLAPILFASGAAGLFGWISGVDALSALAVAVAVGAAVVFLRRRQRAMRADDSPPVSQTLREDR